VISFVVPAYNEERLLPATLAAVHAAGRAVGEPYELIVADDASSDRTATVATAHGARVIPVRHRQIAATRNAGAGAACGTFLFFVDADTVITGAAVASALAALRAGAVGGGAVVRFDEPLPVWARTLQGVTARLFPLLGLTGGCFLYATRAAFAAVGGFDERRFAAEEISMCTALRRHGRFVVVRDAVISSGRKLRAYRGREVARILFGAAIRGEAGLRSRQGLELWYGERREDPRDASAERRTA
jgi:glycosyltransferase involved in cell wall biosynthesis